MRYIQSMNKFLTFIFITFVINIHSQVGMNQWRMFPSPYIVKAVSHSDESVYGLLGEGILEYNIDEETQTLWTAANYLSDVNPTAITYCSQLNTLIIGYNNGNLDLLFKNKIYNIPDILKSSINGLKKINKIIVKEQLAYLVTGIGIVVIDIKKREVKDTYNPSFDITEYLDLAFIQDSIYVLTKNKIYGANRFNQFLADPSQWKEEHYIPDYSSTGRYTELEEFSNQLFLLFKNDSAPNSDTLFHIDNGQMSVYLQDESITNITKDGTQFFISFFASVNIYNSNLTQIEKIYQTGDQDYITPNDVCFAKDYYYIADNEKGLFRAKNSYSTQFIQFEGPRYNKVFRVKWRKEVLAVACGGLNGVGPSFNTNGGSTMENGKWTSTTVHNQPMLKEHGVWDFLSTAINPTNTKEVAFGTLSNIPLILTKNGNVTDTFTLMNSIIEGNESLGWGYMSALTYDDDGNLWMGNSAANKPLKVLAKNGLWYDFNLGNQVKNTTVTRLIIDNNGVKWMTFKNAGIVAFDEGSSIADSGDDRYKVINTGVNNGDLPTNEVNAIAADFDNNIWVGTSEGMRVLYNSENVFDAAPGDYNFQKLLIEYGENVEIVLGTTEITSIQIDGDNRKWIGTANAGVFLLSSDGLEVIKNFTSENSPLLSNSILDIAINQTTGVVYFVTEKGLIAYRSDASQGDQEYSNVKVFPNPVRPDFKGPITIQGIAYNSDVKITDISGKLVYKTKSHGGTATWSGNTMDGNRAATGVYLIWTSIDSDEFKGRKVGKVLLLN